MRENARERECMRVCEREKERESARACEREHDKESVFSSHASRRWSVLQYVAT